jgi:hypothetical protein
MTCGDDSSEDGDVTPDNQTRRASPILDANKRELNIGDEVYYKKKNGEISKDIWIITMFIINSMAYLQQKDYDGFSVKICEVERIYLKANKDVAVQVEGSRCRWCEIPEVGRQVPRN